MLSALSELKDVLAVLANELSTRKVLSGNDAEAIIQNQSPPDVALGACLANVLAKLSV